MSDVLLTLVLALVAASVALWQAKPWQPVVTVRITADTSKFREGMARAAAAAGWSVAEASERMERIGAAIREDRP